MASGCGAPRVIAAPKRLVPAPMCYGAHEERHLDNQVVGGLFFLFMLAVFLAVFAFWIWMLVDCAKYEREGNDKLVWILVIVLTGIFGAMIYFFVRRMPRGGALVRR